MVKRLLGLNEVLNEYSDCWNVSVAALEVLGTILEIVSESN